MHKANLVRSRTGENSNPLPTEPLWCFQHLCKQGYEETQKHIIEECEGTRNTQKQIKYEDIFKDGNTEEMRNIIRTIDEIEEILKNTE